ncbi:PREDICTED: uncharacterized protein LOC104820170 [Tarenaya hassleriana]|uniref:uncharacterized protein LOC104820170 n=1 Tax=Tarenaya hassleriana TaxID=28532 RepID=UPI00053C96A8|nr:PREDICTED: uncharacterized protein LOC104820170 [Tarenaya hassleriana]
MSKFMSRSDSSQSSVRSGNETRISLKEGTMSLQLQYPLLTRTNYAAWSIRMRVYMKAQGVWGAVESDEPLDPRSDEMALAAIFQGISEDTILQLGAKKTAKEAWNALRTMHRGRARSLRRELESLKMEDDDSVDDFTGKVTALVNQLRCLGEHVDESYAVKKILRAASPRFIQIVAVIEQFGDLSKMTIEEVTGSLKAHEERLREWKARRESPKCDEKRSQNHWDRGRGRGRGRGHSGDGRGPTDDGNHYRNFGHPPTQRQI